MALFLTRFKTFVDNVSQITAADMHRLQDELIAVNEWKDAEESSFVGCDGSGNGASVGTGASKFRISTSSGGATVHPITGLPSGVQITSIDFTSHRSGGSNNATVTLHQYVAATDTETDHGNVTTTATGPPTTDVIAAINKTLIDDATYYVSCVAGATSVQTVASMTVHWKRI